MQHGREHEGQPDTGQARPHPLLSDHHVGDHVWQRAVVPDRACQHDVNPMLYGRLHDPRLEVSALHHLPQAAGRPNPVDRPHVVLMSVLGGLAALDVDPERGAEQGRLDVVHGQRVAGKQHLDEAELDQPR